MNTPIDPKAQPVDPNETPEQRQAREEAERKAAHPKDPAHRSGGIPLKET